MHRSIYLKKNRAWNKSKQDQYWAARLHAQEKGKGIWKDPFFADRLTLNGNGLLDQKP